MFAPSVKATEEPASSFYPSGLLTLILATTYSFGEYAFLSKSRVTNNSCGAIVPILIFLKLSGTLSEMMETLTSNSPPY